MPRIGNAPSGENSSLAGTEKVPLSGSQYTLISTIAAYIRTLVQTLTNKTINLTDNTLTGTTAQFNAANSDGDFATLAGSETLTNKTLTTPTIGSFANATHNHEAAAGGGTLDEDALALTDVTTNNASAAKHGLLPKLSGDSTTYLNGDGEWTVPAGSGGDVYDSDVIFQDITTGNADSDSHGFLLKLSMNTGHFLRADGSWQAPPAGGSVYDSDILFSDTTANNSSSDEHGFLPKLSGDSDTYLNGDGEWTTPAGGGVTDAKYVTTASHASLSAEVVIPGFAGSADRSGIGGGGLDYEFDSGASPFSWSVAVDTEDVNSTFPSHLYVQDNGASETLGTTAWSPAGAFDIRCKMSVGGEIGTSAVGPSIALHVSDSDASNRVQLRLFFNGTADQYELQAHTYTGGAYTQRGATNIVRCNYIYARITRDGSNNCSFYYSLDGITWNLIVTQSFTFTVALAGLRIVANSITSNFAIDWLRSNV